MASGQGVVEHYTSACASVPSSNNRVRPLTPDLPMDLPPILGTPCLKQNADIGTSVRIQDVYVYASS
jgi:hypothetical protein